MSTSILIFFFVLVTLSLIQVLEISIDNLPECIILRYTNPITRIRHEKIIRKKTN